MDAPLRLKLADIKPVKGLIGPIDVSTEAVRTYIQPDGFEYKITEPLALFRRDGGSTHRVVTSDGTVHCVPVGPSTVIRWRNRDIFQPVCTSRTTRRGRSIPTGLLHVRPARGCALSRALFASLEGHLMLSNTVVPATPPLSVSEGLEKILTVARENLGIANAIDARFSGPGPEGSGAGANAQARYLQTLIGDLEQVVFATQAVLTRVNNRL